MPGIPYNFPRPYRVDLIDGVEPDDAVEVLTKKFLDQLPTMWYTYLQDKGTPPLLVRVSRTLYNHMVSQTWWDGTIEIGNYSVVVESNYKLPDEMVWMTHITEQ